MGLFGALFAGVSGINSQSNSIGIISNNISNVNTIGFKQGSAAFNTLVVPSGETTFSPGGVIGKTKQLVNQQGLIQGTTSATDIAISGAGLLTVNSNADGSGKTYFTRAGSFTRDALGNFVNTNGYFLQGYPLDANGNPPTNQNFAALKTVNINQAATGSATPTDKVTLAANLNATQKTLLGSGQIGSVSTADIANTGSSANKIIVPTSNNNLVRGDALNITNAGVTPRDTFTYGGFSLGRDITSHAAGSLGDGGNYTVNEISTTGTTFATVTTGATRTTTALTNINVGSTTSPIIASGTATAGLFVTATTLSLGGISVTLGNAGTTDTLAHLQATLQTAMQARVGDAAAGGSTVTITGNPGNYALSVIDKLGTAQAGFGGNALTSGNPTAVAQAATGVPTSSQMIVNVNAATIDKYYTVGQTIYLSGATSSFGGLTTSNLTGQFTVVGVDVATGKLYVSLPSGTATSTATGGGSNITISDRDYPFAGNVLDSSTDAGLFFNSTSTSVFTPTSLSFQITSNGTTSTFTYSAQPTSSGQFNSLNSLASAISNTTGLTANVVNHRLYVSSTDANQSVTFSNSDSTGSGGLLGINWVKELDLQNVASAPTTGVGANRFNTLNGLAKVINTYDPSNLLAVINNPNGSSTISINEANPQQTIKFSDGSIVEGNTADNTGSLVKLLSLKTSSGGSPSLIAGSSTLYTTDVFPIKYNPSIVSSNLSSGNVPSQYAKTVTIYDALGNSHNVVFNFAKLATNTWTVELTASPATDVVSQNNDGQLAYGTISFNGDGSLNKVVGSIVNKVPVVWTNGANASSITVNLGDSGTADGLIQSAAAYNVSIANQNGSSVGQLTGVTIDSSGFVISSFSNGQTQKVYQIPLASINNVNGLESVSGNAYAQTLESGVANLQLAGSNGVGTIASSSLEQSNVDLSTQLTNLIVAQQAYGANSKVLSVADKLLQQLDQIIQ